MTPKEKAIDLCEKFHEEIKYAVDKPQIATNQAKHLSKICCQEIINALPKLVAAEGHGNARFNNPDIEFYTNVLKAIDTL